MLQQLWLRRLTSVLRQSSRSRQQARVARIEALESRLCPSTFTAVNTIPTVPFSGPIAVAVGDFNEDGKQDIVTANASSLDVSVFLGDGTGDFGTPTQFGLGTNRAISVAVGDFNEDGHQDIVFGRGDFAFGSTDSLDETTLLLGNGDGTFATPLLVAAGLNPTSIAVGDFNGDANLDLAVTNGYYEPHFLGRPNVGILLGNGDGTFGTLTGYAVGYTANAVAVGDFNADGKQDLVVTDPAGNKISLLLGNGDADGDGLLLFQTPVSYAPGDGIYLPHSVAIGDFNEDGKQDVAVAYTYASMVVVHEGNGDGTLKPAVLFPVSGKPTQVAVGDFNGDGHQDLVTSNHEWTWDTNRGASVLVGTGLVGAISSGSFLPAEVYAVGDAPQAVAVGDFNNDGADDAAVANSYSHPGSLSILFGASIANVDPVIDSLSATSVNETGVVHLTGTYHDVGTQAHTLTINWGDGALETVAVTDGSFDITHQYLDDPTASDVFTIGVTLEDDDSGSVSGNTATTITNVAPTATNNAYGTSQGFAVSGNVITDAVTDSDPAGANDPLMVTSFTQPANGSVTVAVNGSFIYTPATTFSGSDSFTYSISDGDGGTATATVTITVTPPAAGSVNTVIDTCEGGTALLINGTSSGDQIVVELGAAPGTLRININGTYTTVATPNGRIIVLGDAGDDNIQIAGSILNSAWAYGDAGHDRIFGGGGASLLFGGDGNDQLTGGNGRDILIGGQGADKLVGNSNDDVLIAGYTTKDNRATSGVEEFWCQVMEEWNSSNSFADRLANLRGVGTQKANANNGTSYLLSVVMDDTSSDEIDMLQGSSGNDWFIYRAGEDKVVGQIEAAN